MLNSWMIWIELLSSLYQLVTSIRQDFCCIKHLHVIKPSKHGWPNKISMFLWFKPRLLRLSPTQTKPGATHATPSQLTSLIKTSLMMKWQSTIKPKIATKSYCWTGMIERKRGIDNIKDMFKQGITCISITRIAETILQQTLWWMWRMLVYKWKRIWKRVDRYSGWQHPICSGLGGSKSWWSQPRSILDFLATWSCLEKCWRRCQGKWIIWQTLSF